MAQVRVQPVLHAIGNQSAGLREENDCRDLERDVDYDPEVRALLDGAESPEAVRERMADYVDGADDYTIRSKTGRPEPMKVSFREYDPAVAYVRFLPQNRRAFQGLVSTGADMVRFFCSFG